MKILFCATHYALNNSYAVTAYQIINYLASQGHTIYYVAIESPTNYRTNRTLHENVHILEQDSFGYENVIAYNQAFRPDIILVYSNVVIAAHYVNKLLTIEKTFKLILYIDLTYKWQNYVPHLNKITDKFVCFNVSWEHHLTDIGVPDHKVMTIEYPVEIPKNIHEPSKEDFVVLNFNRNTFRKRIDITLDGFIKFFLLNGCNKNLKLFIKWDDENESGINIRNTATALARDNGLTTQQTDILMNNSIIGHSGDDLSPDDVWKVYGMGHVGLNTSSGEGFSLCSVNHQLCGRPQIISDISTHSELFDTEWCTLLSIKSRIMLPRNIDSGGLQELVSSDDVAEALDFYYKNPEIRDRHGLAGRDHFLNKESPLPKWNDILKL